MDNILINEVGDIKIGDFGVSKQISKDQLLKDRCGTPAYIAPEILAEIPYIGTLADIWSVGILLYAMVYGDFPFKGKDINELEDAILSGKFILENTVSLEAKKLIARILRQEPDFRPTIEEILEDTWMKNIDESGNLKNNNSDAIF